MSRSQRHKISIQNTSTRGEIYAQGRVAPAVLLSATPATPTVPVGAAGGPLKGSSLMGAVPVGWVVPVPKGAELQGSTPSQIPQPPRRDDVPPAAAPKQGLPIGPLPLLAVEPSDNPVGVWYVMASMDGSALRENDDVTIEATGNSATNGNYTVTQLKQGSSDTRFFVPDTELAAPIEGKGRVMITDRG